MIWRHLKEAFYGAITIMKGMIQVKAAFLNACPQSHRLLNNPKWAIHLGTLGGQNSKCRYRLGRFIMI